MDIYTQALVFAVRAHGDQKCKYTGDPYVVHPIRVADILRGEGVHEPLTAVALLHDVLEDTAVTPEHMEEEFGPAMVNLVMEVTDRSRPEDGNREARKAIDRAHIAQASVSGKIIKLADLIDNTESIVRYDPDFARVYLREKRLLLIEALFPGEDSPKAHYRLYNRAFLLLEKAT